MYYLEIAHGEGGRGGDITLSLFKLSLFYIVTLTTLLLCFIFGGTQLWWSRGTSMHVSPSPPAPLLGQESVPGCPQLQHACSLARPVVSSGDDYRYEELDPFWLRKAEQFVCFSPSLKPRPKQCSLLREGDARCFKYIFSGLRTA